MARLSDFANLTTLPTAYFNKSGRKLYRLTAPFAWAIRHADDRLHIVVPSGTLTDFESVPGIILRWIFSLSGPADAAAVLHDFGYQQQGWVPVRDIVTKSRHFVFIPRQQWDGLFLNVMAEAGVPAWKRTIMFWAVRLFGGKGWGS